MQKKETVVRKVKCHSLQDHREKKWCRNTEKNNGGEKEKILFITRPLYREKKGWRNREKSNGGEKGKMLLITRA